MFNKSKKQIVKWIPTSYDAELIVPSPKPAKKFIPDWYKKVPVWDGGEKKIDFYDNGEWDSNATLKKCLPFLDPYMTGYIQELWCDITFYQEGDILKFKYDSTVAPINVRDATNHIPLSGMYYPQEFVWHTPWEPITPKGYSTLYTHAYNRTDLPFFSLTGIIDTDNWSVPGNYPFLIHKGFSGTISAGTPIYQMVPIKREPWAAQKLNHSYETDEYINKRLGMIKQHVTGGYKKLFWNAKSYD